MDAFDVNLLSQVQALNKKLSIAQEQLHLRKKIGNEDKGKGRYPGQRPPNDQNQPNGTRSGLHAADDEPETIIDITI
jgi:hypothetical protein